jgi:DNA-binding ferritin-like protein
MYISAPTDKTEADTAVVVVPDPRQVLPCAGLIEKLVSLSSYLKELETQAHLIHLNYEGCNFIAIHEFLKTQYEGHVVQFDTIAEFVRAMDYWMPMCSNGLREALPCFQHLECQDGRSMLTTYYQNLDTLIDMIEMIEPMAVEFRALDVANYLADLMGQANKSAWFIKATLRGAH